MKKVIFTLIILLFVITASAVALELLIRHFLPVYNPEGMVDFYYNAEDGVILGEKNFTGRQWKNTGDYNVAISINKYGLRDKKDLQNSTEKDLFVVGDSYGFGWGVEEDKRFSNLLAEKLDIPVYNISAGSSNVDSYEKLIEYAKNKGAKIGNLIISLCMENDLLNYNRNLYPSNIKNIEKIEKKNTPFNVKLILKRLFFKIKGFLTKHSALYHAFLSVVHQNDVLCNIAIKTGLIIDNYDGIPKRRYSETVIASSVERVLKIAKPFKATVVIVPSRGLWIGKNRDTERQVHERVVTLLRDGGVNVVDLKLDFEKNGNPLQYHFKNDGHWNEKGHLKVAEAIASSLSITPVND